MSQFPALKTGAVMQYPGTRVLEFSTGVVRFVDGEEQRYRKHKDETRRWAVRLDLLSDEELRTLEEFFLEQQGRLGVFEFVDPWDGSTNANCSFEADEAELNLRDHMRGSTLLWIRRNGD